MTLQWTPVDSDKSDYLAVCLDSRDLTPEKFQEQARYLGEVMHSKNGIIP